MGGLRLGGVLVDFLFYTVLFFHGDPDRALDLPKIDCLPDAPVIIIFHGFVFNRQDFTCDQQG